MAEYPSRKIRVKRLYFLLYLGAILAACALSPQTVEIDPDIVINKADSAKKAVTIEIEVVDTRRHKVIGNRGGVYKDSSYITTSGDITKPVLVKLTRAFSGLGYTTVTGGGSADARLKVEIAEISYIASGENLVTSVETMAEIRFSCQKGTRTITGSYQGSRKKDVIKAPSDDENEQMINNAVATVFQKLLDDKELLAFIEN